MTSTQLVGSVMTVSQGLFVSSTIQNQGIGELVHTNDGRAFRYAYAGAVALAPGKLQQSAAETTAHEILSIAAAAAGSFQVTTTSTVTVTANQYANGFLGIVVTPGVGRMYAIASHPAATSAVLTITLKDAIDVALTTSSKVSLYNNPFYGVVVNPTTATAAPVGVAVVATPINNFGWLQVGGLANVLIDTTGTIGTSAVASTSVAGAVKTQPAGSSSVTAAVVGTIASTGTDTDYSAVLLDLK